MFLLIFESIGTSELLLIGIIALIFLGPRRLPQIARTIGKTMADLRNTTNEFKQTWQREVDFEEEAQALKGVLDDEPEPVARENSILPEASDLSPEAPAIREVDPELFKERPENGADADDSEDEASAERKIDDLSDKRTWL